MSVEELKEDYKTMKGRARGILELLRKLETPEARFLSKKLVITVTENMDGNLEVTVRTTTDILLCHMVYIERSDELTPILPCDFDLAFSALAKAAFELEKWAVALGK